ncbi:MAG TPA: FxsA family protein [Marinagarivorans sp.]
MRGFLLLVVLLPVFDLALMGHLVGFWNTVLLVLGSAVLGMALIRYQGVAALNMGRAKLAAGQMPVSEMTTGLFLAFAGLLFVHPGFITDILGLLCLIPGVRHALAGWAVVRFVASGRAGPFAGGGGAQGGDDTILEGEFEEVTPQDAKRIAEQKAKKK